MKSARTATLAAIALDPRWLDHHKEQDVIEYLRMHYESSPPAELAWDCKVGCLSDSRGAMPLGPRVTESTPMSNMRVLRMTW